MGLFLSKRRTAFLLSCLPCEFTWTTVLLKTGRSGLFPGRTNSAASSQHRLRLRGGRQESRCRPSAAMHC